MFLLSYAMKNGERPLFALRCLALLLIGACDCGGGVIPEDASSGADAGVDAPMLGRSEQCNGADDDLDGKEDEGCPIRLTENPMDDIAPSVEGGRIAWMRRPVGMPGEAEIWLRERDGSVRKIADGSYPDLHGDFVAYLARTDEGTRVHLLRLSTSELRVMDTSDADFVQAPSLGPDTLAWSQRLRGTEEDFEVRVYSISEERLMAPAPHGAIAEFPVIESRPVGEEARVLYRDDRFGHHTVGLLHFFDVFAFEGDGAEPSVVHARGDDRLLGSLRDFDRGQFLTMESFGPVDSMEPRTCRPIVVDVESNETMAFREPSLDCFSASAFSDGRAVLIEDPDGRSDLHLWDSVSGEVLQITDHARYSTSAELEDDLLVWVDDRNDHYDLYMMDLSDLAEGDFLPEGIRR